MLFSNIIPESDWDVPFSKMDGCLDKTSTSVLERPLNISTITMTFTPSSTAPLQESGVKYNMQHILTYMLEPSNKPTLDTIMANHIHGRFPLKIKNLSPTLLKNPVPSLTSEDLSVESSSSDTSSASKKKKGHGHFLNQLTLSYEDEMSNKSIKVFSNKTIHITGCKSPTEARVVATFVWDILCQVYPDTRTTQYVQRIVMVNATCELNYSFNPNTNQKLMSEKYANDIIYVQTGKRRKYPGTILKLRGSPAVSNSQVVELGAKRRKNGGSTGDVTVMMFASGNLTFSSGCLAHMIGAYQFTIQYYALEKQNIISRVPILSKRKIDSTKPKRRYQLKKPRVNARPVNYTVV